LFGREQAVRKLVLPIWNGITRDDLLEYSPALADRLAKIAESDSQDDIVRSMLDLLGKPVLDTNQSNRKLGDFSPPEPSVFYPLKSKPY
jgi:hypothetical protein